LPESHINLEQAVHIRFELRNALQPLGERERIADCLQEAERLADRLNNAQHIGWIQSYLTDHFWILGRYEDAIIAGKKALAIGEQASDLPLQVVTNLPLGLAHHTRGDYPRAIECFRWNATHLRGGDVYERFGMFVLPSSFSFSFIAWAHGDMGNFVEGYEAGEKALQIAESARHPFSCGYAHLGLGVLALRRGILDVALKSFELALGSSGFSDSPVGFAYTALHLGYALALAGNPIEGIQTLEKTVLIAESKGFVARHSLRLTYLSEMYLIVGRGNDAHALATRAWQLASEHDERANQAYALRIIGKSDTYCGRLRDAEDRLSAALQLSEALGMLPLQAHCHRDLADIFEAAGQLPIAITHRQAASALLDQTGMRFWGESPR
jgi:tetratricopeptide (TPR) repeat protein